LASCLACLASLALLFALVPGAAKAVYGAEGPSAERPEGEAQHALEFGEPDPDPDHPDPEEQRVLEDPAGWPWWAWVALLLGLVAVGVPLALFLMRRVSGTRSRTGREGD
jgi:hypothetical protein